SLAGAVRFAGTGVADRPSALLGHALHTIRAVVVASLADFAGRRTPAVESSPGYGCTPSGQLPIGPVLSAALALFRLGRARRLAADGVGPGAVGGGAPGAGRRRHAAPAARLGRR